MPPPKPTHVMQIGTDRGVISMEMSEYAQEIPAQINAGLNRLGASTSFDDVNTFFTIGTIADATTGDRSIIGDEFIQAGGSIDRLSVEISRVESDGKTHEYTVGRPPPSNAGVAPELIRFGDNQVLVHPSEVLTASDAVELFQHYYDHHAIAPGWHLRPLSPEPSADQPNDDTPKATATIRGESSSQHRNTPVEAAMRKRGSKPTTRPNAADGDR